MIVRKNLEQQLRQRRYDVGSATTIAEAQELLSKDNWDLIFVDIRLPDGEGTDLLKQIQSRPQKPLVVMITGFGSVESAVLCMQNGAFASCTSAIACSRTARSSVSGVEASATMT